MYDPKRLNKRWPDRDDIENWLWRLSDIDSYYYDTDELTVMHHMLHVTFGANPSDAILKKEFELSNTLREWGVEHRYKDALSEAAGTTVDNPQPVHVDEMHHYLPKEVVVKGASVRFYAALENPDKIFVTMDGPYTEKQKQLLLAVYQNALPPGYPLEVLPSDMEEDFAQANELYDLVLTKRLRTNRVQLWSEILKTAPVTVLKSGGTAVEITLQSISRHETVVLKSDAESEVERFALGPVLIPGVPDTQGDEYDEKEVRKACHWWMENCGMFSQKHTLQGGRMLTGNEIVALENYIMPVDGNINGKPHVQGTWMLGSRVNDDDIWGQVEAGDMTTWSMGASAVAFPTEESAAV
jgi:hypothetical protein